MSSETVSVIGVRALGWKVGEEERKVWAGRVKGRSDSDDGCIAFGFRRGGESTLSTSISLQAAIALMRLLTRTIGEVGMDDEVKA